MATTKFNAAYFAYVQRTSGAGEAWATIVAGAGTDVSLVCLDAGFQCKNVADKFEFLNRGIMVFDTSSLSGTIEGAVVTLTGSLVSDYATLPSASLGLYTASPGDPENIVAADYGNCEDVLCSDTLVPAASWNNEGHNIMPLNAVGLAEINQGGYTVFCIREANYDVAIVQPPWESNKDLWFDIELCHSAHLHVTYTEGFGADATLNEPIVTLQAMRQIEMQFGGQLSITKSGDFRYKARQGYYSGH